MRRPPLSPPPLPSRPPLPPPLPLPCTAEEARRAHAAGDALTETRLAMVKSDDDDPSADCRAGARSPRRAIT